jgi:NAD(P)-dependent dehydrogenase (short-subunit alcohol dehydrogenase family)
MSSHLEHRAAHEASLFGFFKRQFSKPKSISSNINLTGQVAIVTGSNTGLGFAASRQLLGLHLSTLIVAVRSQERGDAAAAKLRKEFPNATVEVWLLNMSSYESITAFAERCKTLDRIDIAILNVGLMMVTYTIVPETGHEQTLQINYLSTALLAILLLPTMKAKKVPGSPRPPVLTIVGSDIAFSAKLDTTGPIIPQLDQEKTFSGNVWYGKTKLLDTYFIAKLAEYVSADDVLVNISNPGMTKDTSFFDTFPKWMQAAMGLMQVILARTIDVGASTYLDAVLVHDQTSHGSFTSEWTIKP